MNNFSSPGRICLFGEHQDYIKLPVITAAINLYIKITGKKRNDNKYIIDLPDINDKIEFNIPRVQSELKYYRDRDYIRSVFNLLLRNGANFDRGWNCEITGNIPINSGTASSSALCVAWTKFLLNANSTKKKKYSDKKFIGRIAYLAEVEEFGEPGGMMDHYASALGGVLYQDFEKDIFTNPSNLKMGTFVLGDSLEPKNTLQILHRVKYVILEAITKIKQLNSSFKIKDISMNEINDYKSILTNSQFRVLEGTIINRDITSKAKALLNDEIFNPELFKKLLNDHQYILSEYLHISTPKIDKMLSIANKNGAYGGKINGSGGGGCMFVYAPENSAIIAKAIEDVGGKTYIVNVI